ncbi:hypothetical protein HYR69_05585 [Candidatus Sumerlaeota bacterium]|nr:hypothetical protein [Candidatus Sumerlaeota bacterium]
MMERAIDSVRVDRSTISHVKLTDPPDDLQYWLTRPMAEHLSQIEFLRQMNYGYDPDTARLQRVLEYAELKRG